MAPPIAAIFIARIGQPITTMPSDEVVIGAGSPVAPQESTTGTGRSTFGNTHRGNVVPLVGGVAMTELDQVIQ